MNTPKTPLYDGLTAHLAKGRASFHMPGHKGRFLSGIDLGALDLTELPGTDALYEADGIISEAERAAARLFGTQATLFSAGGSTLCIQAMLRLIAPRGGKMLFGRTIHRSAVHAMALLGIEPVWVLPRHDAGEGLPGRVVFEDVEAALREHFDVRGVYLTTPDYYGCLTDLSRIGPYLKERSIPLVLDCAHGAHLPFLPETEGYGAEAAMLACSAHKTLPALTGGAFLHIHDKKYIPHAKDAMALFGSTSPPYPVMASLDLVRAYLESEGAAAFQKLTARAAKVKEAARAYGYALPEGPCDPVRLTLSPAALGYTGEQLAAHLRTQGVEPEYADALWTVLIPTVMNSGEEFERLRAALEALEPRAPLEKSSLPRAALPRAVLSPRQALLSRQESLPAEWAAGRIAASAHCPCPPGVPVIMPGEPIGREHAKILWETGIKKINVVK